MSVSIVHSVKIHAKNLSRQPGGIVELHVTQRFPLLGPFLDEQGAERERVQFDVHLEIPFDILFAESRVACQRHIWMELMFSTAASHLCLPSIDFLAEKIAVYVEQFGLMGFSIVAEVEEQKVSVLCLREVDPHDDFEEKAEFMEGEGAFPSACFSYALVY